MKALSIKQPWSWLICAGYKPIENRNWRIGRKYQHGLYQSQSANFSLSFPARIYVHAGRTLDNDCWEFLEGVAAQVGGDWWPKLCNPEFVDSLPLGVIIGEVDIVAVLDSSPSPWFVGKYGFLLKNPKLYDRAIPYMGQLGFFEVHL